MNSAIAANIDGGVNYQQMCHDSHSSLVSSSIEFSLTEVQTNSSTTGYQGKYLSLLPLKEELFNGQLKSKTSGDSKKNVKVELLNDPVKANSDTNKNVLKEGIFNGQIKARSSDQNKNCGNEVLNGRIRAKSCDERRISGKEDVFNGQIKSRNCDQNKNPVENSHLLVNGNKEKSSEDSIPVPKMQLYTGKISVEWNQVSRIGAGLINLGNSCFMNTVIQCLTYCPPLANYLLQDKEHAIKCNAAGFCMMCLLQRHVKRATRSSGEAIRPQEVFNRLRSIAKHFQQGRQEDAHEFLRFVIEHLWKSCLSQANGVTKLESASKETTVINKIFGGYHRSQVICMQCKKESNTFDHFMDFMLDIKQNVTSLEKALEKFTQPELLQQENCYKCPRCKMKVEAQKRFSVFRAPIVATFQLKRFDYNRSFGGKITRFVSYPEKLNLRPYMSDTKGDPVMYRLNAVLVHSGATCNSGHYYCYVKNSNNVWYQMDDDQVHQVSLTTVLGQHAYVLFYIKMQNLEKADIKRSLDKNAVTKGLMSNSHFSKENYKTHDLKPVITDSSKWTAFSNAKSNSSYDIKKLNSSTQNREKISFSLQTNGTSTPLNSIKSRIGSSELMSDKNKTGSSVLVSAIKSKKSSPEPLSALSGGLVPYIEDSSESSDAAESSLSPSKQSSPTSSDAKHSSFENYSSASCLINRVNRTKSLPGPSLHSSTPKVNATSPWIVTDVPQTPASSSSNTSGVTSTTDWQVIEASDIKVEDSGRQEASSSPKVLSAQTPTDKHLANGSNNQTDLSGTKKLIGHNAQKCNFRQNSHKRDSSEEEEPLSSDFKRKYSDSYSKVSKGSSYSQRGESRHSPVPKKAKYAENNFSFLSKENGVRDSGLHVANSSDSSPVQRHYSASLIRDNHSRTSVENCDTSSLASSKDFSKNSSVLNGWVEKDRKEFLFCKARKSQGLKAKPLNSLRWSSFSNRKLERPIKSEFVES